MTDEAVIKQLQDQQALFTRALKAMLEGDWRGGPETVEAYTYALNPAIEGTITFDIPITESTQEHPKGG
jgi:hypothetical protein